MKPVISKMVSTSLLTIGLAASLCATASYAAPGVVITGGNYHQHDGYRGQYHGHGGYYNRGGYFYGGGGWGWGGPNVVINVPPPVPRYYVAPCENMEVCDSYGECWIEQYCG